jgi:hypothetical protein
MIFGMRRKKKSKKYAKEKGFSVEQDVAVWRDFKPPRVSEAI